MSEFVYKLFNGVRYLGDNTSRHSNGVHSGVSYAPKDGILIIPAYPPIYAIGKFAFYNNTNLKEVRIEAKVVEIHWGAFSFCPNIAKINIPNSLVFLFSYALEFYDGVKKRAGAGTSIIVFEHNSQIQHIESDGISRKENVIIYFCEDKYPTHPPTILSEVRSLKIYSKKATTFLGKETQVFDGLLCPIISKQPEKCIESKNVKYNIISFKLLIAIVLM